MLICPRGYQAEIRENEWLTFNSEFPAERDAIFQIMRDAPVSKKQPTVFGIGGLALPVG